MYSVNIHARTKCFSGFQRFPRRFLKLPGIMAQILIERLFFTYFLIYYPEGVMSKNEKEG